MGFEFSEFYSLVQLVLPLFNAVSTGWSAGCVAGLLWVPWSRGGGVASRFTIGPRGIIRSRIGKLLSYLLMFRCSTEETYIISPNVREYKNRKLYGKLPISNIFCVTIVLMLSKDDKVKYLTLIMKCKVGNE